MGHNIAGQNSTNAATAAAAVRLDVVRRHPGAANEEPQRVQIARCRNCSGGIRWIIPQL